MTEHDELVEDISNPITMYFGPETVLLSMEVKFRSGLPAHEVGNAVDRIERAVHSRQPEVKHIYIEPDELEGGPGDTGK